MDSSQGIAVEYKLDAFNMPRTGTTLCHPKMLLFRSRHLAIYSPLGHFNGNNAYSPPQKYQTHETHGDIQSSIPSTATWLSPPYGEHNPSHVSILTTSPRVLRHQKQTQYSMPQIEPISKNTFRLSPSGSFILPLLPYKLSEETTQRKHAYVTPSSSLNTNKYFPA